MSAIFKRNLPFLVLSWFIVHFVIYSQAERTNSSGDKHQEIILQTQDSSIKSETFHTAEESFREIDTGIKVSTSTSSNNLDDGAGTSVTSTSGLLMKTVGASILLLAAIV